MTFYKSSGSRTGSHEELNLADFEPINMLPRRRSLSGFGKKPAESSSVDIYPYNPNSKRLNIKFETPEGQYFILIIYSVLSDSVTRSGRIQTTL